MVSEGFLRWTIRPWIRRLVTRGIAIIPCMIVASAVGRTGLAAVLNASQVALSILLPFVTAPLIYFTTFKKFMRVPVTVENGGSGAGSGTGTGTGESQDYVDLSNSWPMSILAILIWVFIAALNVYVLFSPSLTCSSRSFAPPSRIVLIYSFCFQLSYCSPWNG